MSANVNEVEHAITETLNGMQLGEKCIVQKMLNELRDEDPSNFKANARLYEKMTHNYAGFPHLEIEKVANSPDDPIKCPKKEHLCPTAQAAPPQREVSVPPPAPLPQAELAPPSPPAAVAPPYVERPQIPLVQQYQEQQYPDPRMQMAPGPRIGYVAEPPPPTGPSLATAILGSLAQGLGEGAAAVLTGRMLGGYHQPRPFMRYNNIDRGDDGYDQGFRSYDRGFRGDDAGFDPNAGLLYPPLIISQPEPEWRRHQHYRRY